MGAPAPLRGSVTRPAAIDAAVGSRAGLLLEGRRAAGLAVEGSLAVHKKKKKLKKLEKGTTPWDPRFVSKSSRRYFKLLCT